ncbi:WD40 repeat domain-containing protein [Rodentibacter sp. Ppn85]|uniref:WD40 repeat domain-containing protein n=1 Tax=Rodentibacter sp. Ppn85 TaxID=1908525 RepID=UPI0009848E87|nr:hypothetical protein [Rodentibacter sp. Ppn85]OOF66438.1 hypothetical protein BKL51_01165 [Rodentibacter sp. Ppn85]
MKNKHIAFSFLGIVVLFIVIYVVFHWRDLISETGVARTVGVSSDGKYVISAHRGKTDKTWYETKLVLWDIEKREKKVIAEDVNTDSAYFIPNSHDFMWQSKSDNVVHIQNIDGRELASFKHFKITRHIMSADRTFYASADQTGEIYKGYGENIVPIYTDTPLWRHYNFDLSGKYFLTATSDGPYSPDSAVEFNPKEDPVQPSVYKKSSYNGVTLWDRETLKPVARLGGFGGRSDALFSPDEKWIVGGGENRRDYMWEVSNLQRRLKLANAESGIYNPETEMYDTSQLLPIPDKFKNKSLYENSNTVTYAFLNDTDFIQLKQSYPHDGSGQNIASIYRVGSPWIIGYVEIGNVPVISTDGFEKANSVDSAPKANILVTGQAVHGGINVYRYHPDKMKLEKIWVAY